ncbi:6724_t:CDS:2 [Funneliformis geosporum]|nr:6724_t:CDS:2 [Funneliformis geosporum]
MEMGELKELLLNELTKEQKYLLNTKQAGEASELLGSLTDNSTSLVFLDPQYEPEATISPNKRKHPHQKPKELLKALILATTSENDLVVDLCAGSFVVLEKIKENFMRSNFFLAFIRTLKLPLKLLGDIPKQSLEGRLDLRNSVNLKALNCSRNQLTSINLSNCKKLRVIDCGYNRLTNLDLTGLNELEKVEYCDNYLETFDYSSLNPEKLTELNITANKLLEKNISVFKIQQGYRNRFIGSLEFLKNLVKLKSLHISNTDIDSGLEYLPSSIEEIYCSSQEISESKVLAIENLLKNSDEFVSSSNGYVRKFTYKNAEEYLQKKYSDKENTKLIKFNNNALQLSEKGELVISDYPNLEEIRAIGSENINNITKVTVANCSKLKEIDITNFVDNERLEITNCSDLEKLYCGNNKLSAIKGLNLTNCGKLNDLECNENQLTQLTLPKLDNLQKLICYNNNLTNLKFVQQSTKLEILSIGDNNITTGLEYLPVSLKEFWCEQRGEIWNELALYGKNLRA